MQEKILSDVELRAFCDKVRKLKAEGLNTATILRRLGVPRSTLNERLRRARAEEGET